MDLISKLGSKQRPLSLLSKLILNRSRLLVKLLKSGVICTDFSSIKLWGEFSLQVVSWFLFFIVYKLQTNNFIGFGSIYLWFHRIHNEFTKGTTTFKASTTAAEKRRDEVQRMWTCLRRWT